MLEPIFKEHHLPTIEDLDLYFDYVVWKGLGLLALVDPEDNWDSLCAQREARIQ